MFDSSTLTQWTWNKTSVAKSIFNQQLGSSTTNPSHTRPVHTVCVHVPIVHMLIIREELHKASRLHLRVHTWTGTQVSAPQEEERATRQSENHTHICQRKWMCGEWEVFRLQFVCNLFILCCISTLLNQLNYAQIPHWLLRNFSLEALCWNIFGWNEHWN